jgi:hypothetical protein
MKRHTTVTAGCHVVINLEGLNPTNEDDVNEVCNILAQVMRADGNEILVVEESVQDEDCKITINGNSFGIQVVRALIDPRFWKTLNHSGSNSLTLTVDECAQSLRKAISLKEHKIPKTQRHKLILLLDAYRLPAFSLGIVVDEFKIKEAVSVKELGFHSIYVVGPSPIFVSRLDELRCPHAPRPHAPPDPLKPVKLNLPSKLFNGCRLRKSDAD